MNMDYRQRCFKNKLFVDVRKMFFIAKILYPVFSINELLSFCVSL